MKVCPNCKQKIQDKMTVCPYCGKSLKPTPFSRIRSNPKYRMIFVFAILALGLVISGSIFTINRLGLFAPKASCFDQSQAYLNQFMPLFSQWTATDQNNRTLNKQELELSLITLEGIRQQIVELNPPTCAQTVHKIFASYMDETLNGYNAFVSGAPQDTVKSYIEKASEYYTVYRSSVLELYPELSVSPTPGK